MSWRVVSIAVTIALGATATQAASQSVAPPVAVVAPPAAAFKVGALVTDRIGAPLGPIQSVADAAGKPIVVIKIDGKMVGVPQSTLTIRGEGAVSSQTKAEVLAAAHAPQ